MSPEDAPRFAADAMLGRLARWLRALGFDTAYDIAIADPVLVELANAEGRILLTRDRHLLRDLRPQRAVEVRVDDPLQQLRDVAQELALTGPVAMFSRCLLCNALLVPLSAREQELLLAGMEHAPSGPVLHCPICRKLYWDGSHARRMRRALEQVLPGWGAT
ncbi:hypothetical protein HHL11_01420 [Ramlibacter sp. G-1-2-2]|uniref:Mut7-C RNAse domain-containing protein n=1 Tax=Ramlibacter agri TaxID=2728837 RepID=A0A848H3N7_9BURK|nr:Mut7-C RNAse domain-containing protein [Ramlibacter agri]NML42388.1 hypothetical protein [Ramlibacter agri]